MKTDHCALLYMIYLFPSLAGSENKESLVGRPGSLARNTEPSGSTSFLNTSKLLCPGLSLQIPTGQALINEYIGNIHDGLTPRTVKI